MFKKVICVLLAALIVCGLCACGNNGGGQKNASATPTPAAGSAGQSTELVTKAPAPEDPFEGLADDAVILSFTGLVEANVTVAQLKELTFVTHEGASADDPDFSGPSFKDVMALIGAENVTGLTAVFNDEFSQSFNTADFDVDSAFFAVLRDGASMGENNGFLMLVTNDGFNYMLELQRALELR